MQLWEMSRDVSLPQAKTTSGRRLDIVLLLAFKDNKPEAAVSPLGSSCSLLLLQSTCGDMLLSPQEAARLAPKAYLAATRGDRQVDARLSEKLAR